MSHNTPYQAPDFKLKSAEGQETSLADFAGQWLVLYFYPKDDTPGCTAEACSLRDARDDITDLGASVVGVSKDDSSSHQKFKAKHNLNFTLLSDPEATTIEAYGALGGALGVKTTQRKTFIIDPDGQVVKIYDKVTPGGHGDQVIEDLRELQDA